jgi:hypothetical protein
MQRHRLETSAFDGLVSAPPLVQLERLCAIKSALPTCDDPELLAALAQAIPSRVASLAPEIALALGEIALALAPAVGRSLRIADDDEVRDALLRGAIKLDAGARATLVRELGAWPKSTSPSVVSRLPPLVPHLSEAQLRAFVPEWIAAWEAGAPAADALLRAFGNERLFPFVVARARAGSTSLTQPAPQRVAGDARPGGARGEEGPARGRAFDVGGYRAAHG